MVVVAIVGPHDAVGFPEVPGQQLDRAHPHVKRLSGDDTVVRTDGRANLRGSSRHEPIPRLLHRILGRRFGARSAGPSGRAVLCGESCGLGGINQRVSADRGTGCSVR